MKIGLGVCARDEESTIVATLSSIVRSASVGPEPGDWKLLVCANGCTDGTVHEVATWIKEQDDPRIGMFELEDANLVEAQRMLAEQLVQQGATILGFFDGDILVEQECIPSLLETMADQSVRAAYAVPVPLQTGSETLVEKVMNQYDHDRRVYSQRRHLHGRAFVVREWSIPRTSPPLLSDDIFISCDLLLRHGEDSIKQSKGAKIYFHQVSTIGDVYQAYKRRNIELRKCLQLNPSFRHLPPNYINRHVIWRNLIDESPRAIGLWLVLFALRLYCRIRLLLETNMPWHSTAWRPTRSSKRPFSERHVFSTHEADRSDC